MKLAWNPWSIMWLSCCIYTMYYYVAMPNIFKLVNLLILDKQITNLNMLCHWAQLIIKTILNIVFIINCAQWHKDIRSTYLTLEELEGLTTMIEEDQLIEFAYPIILITFLEHLQPPSRRKVWSMVLSMNFSVIVHFRTYLSKTYRVLSVMFLPDLELSWFQLKQYVHHPGPGSTMATSRLSSTVTIGRHLLALMLTQE